MLRGYQQTNSLTAFISLRRSIMNSNDSRQKRNQCLIHQFMWASRIHRGMIEEQVKKIGIHSSQHRMLGIIAADKDICQKDIAQRLNISSAAVAVTLGKLEAAGLIERSQFFEDARKNHIRITDKAADILRQTNDKFVEIDDRFLGALTEEELDTLSALVLKICHSLKPECCKPSSEE